MDSARLRELEASIRKRSAVPLREQIKIARLQRKPAPKSVLRVWQVECPTNKHLTTLVTSPIQPNYCPVCGELTSKITERV